MKNEELGVKEVNDVKEVKEVKVLGLCILQI